MYGNVVKIKFKLIVNLFRIDASITSQLSNTFSVFNQIKTALAVTLCTLSGTKSSVSLQLSKNMMKQSYCTHPVKAGTCSVQ